MNLLKDEVSTLVRKLAIPASIGTLFQTLYTIVDTFYAGKISPEALSALSKSFPIFFIIIATSIGVTVAGTSLIGSSIGEKNEKKSEKENQIIKVPNWEILEDEKKEINPAIWIFIYSDNNIIKKIKAKNKKGLSRVSWNLSSESQSTISKKNFNKEASGSMVNPGEYTAQLFKQIEGKYISISDKRTFKVNQISKGAIEGLTRSLAAEFAPKIRVNAIAPSILDTPLAEKFLNSETKLENTRNRHPMKEIGSPKDISEIVKFLLEDNSKWMTGQIIPFDGGMSSVKTN